jgi:PAS domain S-box-containing protein
VLVAVMRKLADTVPMAAFDHKGRCVYANTPLASMLGYKLSVLRAKEISQLLPQPYGRLHMKWITVRGADVTACCR